jgi:CheY-like chemotaxis protein
VADHDRNRILVIDDDADVARGLARLLRARGYDVAVAPGGFDGVQALAAEPWDFVLCDLCMPGLSGIDVAKVAAQLPKPPVFRIMTGTPTTDLVPLVEEIVGVPPLGKPVPEAVLLDEIERATRRQGAGPMPRSPAGSSSPPTSEG